MRRDKADTKLLLFLFSIRLTSFCSFICIPPILPPVLLSLSDLLTDIAAQSISPVHRHTINSGFIALFPFLPALLFASVWMSSNT